jgi:hypothetical protein
MFNISVEKTSWSNMKISPMSIKRDWMDATSEKHAYRCFPVSQANVIGWNISCLEDVSFIWDGINSQTGDNVKILAGGEIKGNEISNYDKDATLQFRNNFYYTGRGQSSVSFNTGLYFKTEQNVSLFTINPVNYFNSDFETMSSLISTSFLDNPLPLAIKAKSANKEILIKAGTPLATIIPISLGVLNNSCIEINKYQDPENKRQEANKNYGEAAQVINQSGKWTDWYRDAVNEKGESLGSHEVKTLKLNVKDNTILGT